MMPQIAPHLESERGFQEARYRMSMRLLQGPDRNPKGTRRRERCLIGSALRGPSNKAIPGSRVLSRAIPEETERLLNVLWAQLAPGVREELDRQAAAWLPGLAAGQ
jgi:hypothetical protein